MPSPTRFIALDIHKAYFVASGVNAAQEPIFGPQRVPNERLHAWIEKHLTTRDAVVLEMTTNAYVVYDALKEHVHSVTVVHPPHVALITRAQVKTDCKAALALAQLLAAGLLVGVWIPPQEVRDLRALLAQRRKMVSLATVARNRLHAVLHRHHLKPPEGSQPFSPKHADFWLSLPVSTVERTIIQSNWETAVFAECQKKLLEQNVAEIAARDARVPLLVQLPGIGLVSAVTLLAAIGDITRFPTAKQLVGYAGLGTRIHESGKTHHRGRITKAGRKDIRYVMVQAAQTAARTHPHWKAELARLEPRLGRNKAIVAIARKLLLAVWHVLTEGIADRFADPHKVASAFFSHAYRVGVPNLPHGQSALMFARSELDRLRLGAHLTHIRWGSRKFKMPPSKLVG